MPLNKDFSLIPEFRSVSPCDYYLFIKKVKIESCLGFHEEVMLTLPKTE